MEVKLEFKGNAWYTDTQYDWSGATMKLLNAVLDGALSAVKSEAEEKTNEYLQELGLTSGGGSE